MFLIGSDRDIFVDQIMGSWPEWERKISHDIALLCLNIIIVRV